MHQLTKDRNRERRRMNGGNKEAINIAVPAKKEYY
jgi:hypothetical protein